MLAKKSGAIEKTDWLHATIKDFMDLAEMADFLAAGVLVEMEEASGAVEISPETAARLQHGIPHSMDAAWYPSLLCRAHPSRGGYQTHHATFR